MKRLRLSGLLLLILCLSLLAIPFWNDRIVRRYIDKIWLHRTNSIEKLHEFEQEYKNFECVVLFLTDSATFEIGHDEPSGEPLKPYLDFLGTNPDRELWLDLKNLNITLLFPIKGDSERRESKSHFGERKGTLSQMNLFIKTGQTQSIYPRNNDTKHEIQ